MKAEYELRETPSNPKLLAAAQTASPGAWVYDIDWDYPSSQPTPPEAIRGGWEVGQHGTLTGRYAPNPRYRAVERSSRKLKPYMYACATSFPLQWVTDVEPRGESSFPNVPEEYIRGWWYVDATGSITDLFRPSSRWSDPGLETPDSGPGPY